MRTSTAPVAPVRAALHARAGTQQELVATLLDVQDVLAGFAQHGLDEAAKSSLMNRVDTKYLVPVALLGDLLRALRTQYSVLCVEDGHLLRYRTDYYDTDDFRFYHEHHNGKSRRCKVRCRQYVDSGGLYLELKARESSGRTVKNRIRLGLQECDLSPTGALQEGFSRLGLDSTCLQRRVQIEYLRMALQGVGSDERVSIDLGLQGLRVDEGQGFSMSGLAIVELKQGSMDRQSPLFRELRRLHINSLSFSKYCVTCALLYPGRVKTNRFKPLLSRLDSHVVLAS